MDASFEEKSVRIQLIGTGLGLGLYFVLAGPMLFGGVTALPVYVPLFIAAVILIVVINAAGHAAAALFNRDRERDERDRLIGWRAESNSSWILGAGVILAILGMIVSLETVWIAHLLLFSLFLSEVAKNVSQLVYYRRGL